MFNKNLSASKRIYRATERSFESFHEICDGRDDIVVVVKANQRVFGIYSRYGFNTNQTEVDQESESFAFSLTPNGKYPIKSGKISTTYTIDEGPAFGKDLIIRKNKGSSNLGDIFVTDGQNGSAILAGSSEFQID